MGAAHAGVTNKTKGHICVITFNKSELIFNAYANLYIIDPNTTQNVEAITDPIGLYVAIVYKASDGYLHYKKWLCQNETELIVNSINKYDIEVSGGKGVKAIDSA